MTKKTNDLEYFPPTWTGVSRAYFAYVARNLPLIITIIVVTVIFYQFDPIGGPAFFAPIVFAAGLWLVLFGFKDKADHRAMLAHFQGTPKDGQWAVACGKAVALEPGDDDTLAVRFQVIDEIVGQSSSGSGTRSKQLKVTYDGFYLVPTGIKTESDTVRLAGFPDLLHTDKRPMSNDMIVAAKAAAIQARLIVPKPVIRDLAMEGARERIEISIHYGFEPESTEGSITSWMLREGEDVCVFGRWKDGALTPDRRRPRGLPVYTGTEAEVCERLGGDSQSFLIVGVVVIAIAAGLAVWSLL